MTRYGKGAVLLITWLLGVSFVLADERTPATPTAEAKRQVRFVVDGDYENEFVIPASRHYYKYGSHYRRPTHRHGPRYQVYRYPHGAQYGRYYYRPNYRYGPRHYYGPYRSYYYGPYSFPYSGPRLSFGFSF